MSEQTPGSAAGPLPLPDAPNIKWLRKQAKRRLEELRQSNADAQLSDAQFDLAKQYGFASWRALKAHIDSLALDGQLFAAARSGDVRTLTALLDAHPDKLHAREKPYGWTLLHAAAHSGHLTIVELLLQKGLDVNVREHGDNTYAMHWAAAAGHVDVVRRLADAGGDVIGHGDDHELEVIGWASSWDGCDDDAHRSVVDLLIERGARHHIFSAIAMNLGAEVRRIVQADPAALSQRMSHNENFQLPLHFAVRMNRADMVALLLELGADPAAGDGSGATAKQYAARPNVEARAITMLALGTQDVFSALAEGDEATAARLVAENSGVVERDGVLHLMAKRGDLRSVRWLLSHGADPNARWDHWGAVVTPLHLAALQGHIDVVRELLAGGADPNIHDSMHDSPPAGWAYHGGQMEIHELLTTKGRA